MLSTEEQKKFPESWSDKTFYLITFCFTTGLTIARTTAPWLVRKQAGVLVLLVIQLIFVFILTVPCIFMELALGQYSSKALIKIWDLCPIFRGIGYASVITFILTQIFNNVIISELQLYSVLSFGNEEYWKWCSATWNKENCFTFNGNYSMRIKCYEKYSEQHCNEMEWESSFVQFIYYRVVKIGEEHKSKPNYEVILFSFIPFTFAFFANYHGVKSAEKFLIVLIILPTFQLIYLFFYPLMRQRGFVTLKYLFSDVDLSLLKDPTLWIQLLKVVSSDSGLGFGGYITLGTMRSFRTPILLRSITVSLVIFSTTTVYAVSIQNFLTSMMALHKMNKKEFYGLEDQLMFPDSTFFLPNVPKIWTQMWSSHLAFLGMRNVTSSLCLLTEITYNSYPRWRKHHTFVILGWCSFFFIGVILFSTRIGYFTFKTMNDIIIEVGLPAINLFKVIAIVYCYGVNNFLNDVHFMLGIKLSPAWKLFYVINPLLFGMVLVNSLRNYYYVIVEKVSWTSYLKHAYMWFNVAVILSYMLYSIIKKIKKKQYNVIEPSEDWGPKDPYLRKSRQMFNAQNMTNEYVYRHARFGANRF